MDEAAWQEWKDKGSTFILITTEFHRDNADLLRGIQASDFGRDAVPSIKDARIYGRNISEK